MTTRHRMHHRSLATASRVPGVLLALTIALAASAAFAWTPLAVVNDPLVRQPGSQENDGIVVEPVGNCMNCHAGYDPPVEPGALWRGSMMAQAARDPIFWATVTVAAQDSIWAAGRPNATDICLRCHTPPGWLGGRSDPTNGSALATTDFDGITCDFCHSSYDPFHESTAAGTREGSDWTGYWDETGASSTPSGPAAQTTLADDRAQSATKRLFNGNPMYSAQWQPLQSGYTEHASGQYFVSPTKNRRASFADASAKHPILYSRYHKSRYFCGTCHDVSNPVLANLGQKNTAPGDGTTVLQTEQASAYSYSHVERTQSEFLLSGYGTGQGADGVGPYAPASFKTSRPANRIAACQDCHMADGVGVACNKTSGVLRPTGSTEHPKSGLPLHHFAGGNALVPRLLASTVVGSANYDAFNATLLRQGPAVLTLDLTQGEPLDAAQLLAQSNRSLAELQKAASLQLLSYSASTGSLTFRIQNQTGHKLLTGYPEGRRMFVNIRGYAGGTVSYELNPYDDTAGTLRGLDPAVSPNSPPLGANQSHRDELVYESHPKSSLTGETQTFHFALATGREKDNRIPPKGFRISEAAARLSEPVWHSASAPDYFTTAEYAGGYDDVALTIPANLESVEIRVFYQSFSREYAEFLRNEVNGTATTLASPAPSGEAKAYVAQTDPFFARLKAWGTTIWQVWDHNRTMPGVAPVLMASATIGQSSNPCAAPGSDGTPCNDGNACTQTDTCQSGTCTGSNPVTCTALDACHDVGTCNTSTGVCSNPIKPNGTACNDGAACTVNDVCSTGVCVGTSYTCIAGDCQNSSTCDGLGGCTVVNKSSGAACTDDGNPCSSDTCDGSGVCQHPPLADGTSCGSNQICQGGSCGAKCQIGGTFYASGTINPSNACERCDPATSSSSWSNQPNGTGCSDANDCTSNDACQSGTCAGTPYTCTPGICETSSTCNGAGGCTVVNKANGVACTDDGNSCSTDLCNAGICEHPALADGTACGSGLLCQGGSCGPKCQIGSNLVAAGTINPSNPCERCDPTASTSAWSPVANGTACEDGNTCTKNDVCAGGLCGGTAYACTAADCDLSSVCDGNGGCLVTHKGVGTGCTDDGNHCTADTCDGQGACEHPAEPDGTSCGTGFVCNAGACSGGCLINGTLYLDGQLNAANACEVCNVTMSTAGWSDRDDGTSCDDGNGCTQTDTCQSGTCAGGNAKTCTAIDECHTDGTCDITTGDCSTPTKADGETCLSGTCLAGVCTPDADGGTDGGTVDGGGEDGGATDGAPEDGAIDGAAGAGGAAGTGGSAGKGGAAGAGGAAGTAGKGGYAGATADAGLDAGEDAGFVVPEEKDEGGCGCHAAGSQPAGKLLLAALVAALVIARRKRGCPGCFAGPPQGR